jgi:glycerophosphoryl diester phosphodiesterase
VDGAPLVIAHRGAAAEAPENTIEAFDLAVTLGADALELDVQRAADGALVVIHDSTVDRTTDADGPVTAFSGAELARLGVPALEEVLRRYHGLEITVDVKAASATDEVVALIGRLERISRTILYVEDGTRLDGFAAYAGRRATSSRQAAWLASTLGDGVPFATGLPDGFPEVVHAPMVGPDGPIVTAELVGMAQRVGRTVQVWTIDDPERMRRLGDWGVDGIITNDVRRAVELLKGYDEAN